jgi:hypothetical protein
MSCQQRTGATLHCRSLAGLRGNIAALLLSGPQVAVTAADMDTNSCAGFTAEGLTRLAYSSNTALWGGQLFAVQAAVTNTD